MSNLSEIGVNFSTYLVSLSPQVKNNSLQWYLSGSLATIMMAGAESITEVELDEENNIKSETMSKEITEEQRRKMAKFTRKLGLDIDVVNVNGNFFNGAPPTNKPHIQNIIQNVPNVLELMSWTQSMGGSMYIDNLQTERKISCHPVVKVKTANGDVYVAAPPEQFAYKLLETILFSDKLLEENVSDTVRSKYQKDIKDLSSMFYGFKDLYDNNEFLNKIYNILNEKHTSLFSIHNPLYNSDNAIEGHDIFYTHVMRRIIEDSINYLQSITDDKSAAELNDFFSSLLDRRRQDAEKISRNPSADTSTPLQRRKAIKYLLEKALSGYKNMQPKDQHIGEE